MWGVGAVVIRNSVLGEKRGSAADNNFVGDPGFLRNANAKGTVDYGNLHLKQDTADTRRGQDCPAQDLDNIARSSPCSAGAYEYSEAALSAGGLRQPLEVGAVQATTVFSTSAGAVTLVAPAGAVTQTVHLAFSLGRPTGGDGRELGVVFTPLDDQGSPLPEGFTFLKPLTLTLEYDPALVTHGLESSLLPERFSPLSGAWLPFASSAQVDRDARTVSFLITQPGEYGLFAQAPGVSLQLVAYNPGGVENLAGGSLVTYTLAAQNSASQAATGVEVSHTLPAGLSFEGWVQANGASYDSGKITWPVGTLSAGGLQLASFSARVSSDAQYRGTVIHSTAGLVAHGASTGAETAVSVNAPAVPVDDSLTTAPDTAASLRPVANDENPDLSPLTLAAVGIPGHGKAVILDDGVVYTPALGYQGNDSFSYTVQDGEFTVTGTVNVRVASLAFLKVGMTLKAGGVSGLPLVEANQTSEVTYTLRLGSDVSGEIAQGVTLSDTLPAGIKFLGWVEQSGAQINGSLLTWSAASLPAGGQVTISFRAQVVGEVGSVVQNAVLAEASNADPAGAITQLMVLPPRATYLPYVIMH